MLPEKLTKCGRNFMQKKQKVVILGATGSIGNSTLSVIRKNMKRLL